MFIKIVIILSFPMNGLSVTFHIQVLLKITFKLLHHIVVNLDVVHLNVFHQKKRNNNTAYKTVT